MRLYDYPLSDDFKETIASICERMDRISQKIDAIKEAVLKENAANDIKRTQVAVRLNKLEHSLKALESQQVGNLVIIHEPFVDSTNCDRDALHFDEAEVSPAQNMLTLKRTSVSEVGIASIQIAEGNGQPGNAHQVYRETGLYHARDGLHTGLNYIIDGYSDTWFEYESLTGLPGYRYHNAAFLEGLHWLKLDMEPLELLLEAETDSLTPVGAVVVDPFIPSVTGYQAPCIDSIVLDDKKGGRQKVTGAQFSRAQCFTCLPQKVKKISIAIRQESPYYTYIGLPDRAYPISIVQMGYDPFTGKVTQPVYSAGSPAADETGILETYYSSAAAEIVPALRYQIGLRHLAVLAHTYAEKSEYISKPYYISGGIRSIEINSIQSVPESLIAGQLVKTSISIDDGTTWYDIATSDSESLLFNLPRQVVFGKYVPVYMRSSRVMYLDAVPDSFRVRILLSRPVNIDLAEYITPVVTEYTAIVEQAGGAS